MVTRGRIGDYDWVELSTEVAELRDLVAVLGDRLQGLRAVNVSWDSGHMHELVAPLPKGWENQGRHVVSPVLTPEMLVDWPQSHCNAGRYDEWYFFSQLPQSLSLQPFCNWGGMSLAQAAELAFPGGFDLAAQLSIARPEMIIGDGTALFVIGDQDACSKGATLGHNDREA